MDPLTDAPPDADARQQVTALFAPCSPVALPAVGVPDDHSPVGISAAGDDRTFVLWSDDSARHVIGEQTLFQRNPPQPTDRYGVAAAGKFTKFQVAQHGQWYSGPAF